MICSISGEQTIEPVISPKSGCIFEKKHIINYIKQFDKDPINNEQLTIDDLIPINQLNNQNLNSPVTDSIPSLLSNLQNEYDSIVLENFTLKKQLQLAKQELSISLYKQDAAINVAAKAIQERDDARMALEKLTTTLVEEDKIDDIDQAKQELFQKHKSQKVKIELNDIVYEMDSEVKYKKKIIDFYYNNEIDVIVGKQKDKLIIYSINGDEISSKTAHADQFTINNNQLIAYSKANIIFIDDNQIKLPSHVEQIINHPSLNLFIILQQNSWSIINTEKVLVNYKDTISHGTLHQDGEILAAIKQEKVYILSISNGAELGSYDSPFKVVRIRFASNGYWLLIQSNNHENSTIQIIDLRKSIEISKIEIVELIDDFIIDPTSNLIITWTKTHCKLYRFMKKDKEWKLISQFDLKVNNLEFVSTVVKLLQGEPIQLLSIDIKSNKFIKSCIINK
ncbi:unnamed protein product [Candida verbasci]|uniref:Pre-mRNA-processing factor 19 n=1 Tax=Candida verbasci TaxID=1227364 RepID=A0A9W4XAD6_9ASCO|nr:unnamed protein product [Candida verbasci]